MDDDFDTQFADELDALQDFDEDYDYGQSKGKRQLDFSTPSTKQPKSRVLETSNALNDSMPTPLEVSDKKSPVKSQKRMTEDLFGDLSDDEENQLIIDEVPELEPKKKRAKLTTSHEAEFDEFEITPPPSPDISDVIKWKRQTKQDLGQREKFLRYDVDGRVRVHRKIPDSDFVAVTGADGQRVYMSVKEEEQLEKEYTDIGRTGKSSLDILGTPIAVLRAQIEESKKIREIEENNRLADIADRDRLIDLLKEPEYIEDEKHNLWVEKYSPGRYTDLLSDEATNRALLKWLKLWDHVVFGKEKKIVKDNQKKPDNQTKKYKGGAPDVNEELDEFDRPYHKVALLCGPPGLGKTTLAHVIARHAGYNVVEMNASDDRTADAFQTKINSATQMRSVIPGVDSRPNCLIIDEIDGAPQPAINVLLSVIKQTEQIKKKKKKQGGLLLRPIICICNDQWVPSLRQLKPLALIVNFPRTIPHKLASRLYEVSKEEALKTDLTTLLALCEKSDNDIRSCLNTLQFIRGRTKQLTLQHVHSLSLGQKDAHKSLFAVWQHIFQMPRAQRKRYINPYDRAQTSMQEAEEIAKKLAESNTSMGARFNNTYAVAIAAGEYEKVLQGIHENYLEIKVKDPRLQGLQLANEWMIFGDILQQEINHTQNYIFGRYIPYIEVAFHLVYASNHPHRISYPHSQYEFRQRQTKVNNLVTSMTSDVTPSVRKNLNVTTCTLEVLPPLVDIIQPTLRPVNTQLYSKKEKEDLAQLIRIMIAYNLTYHQERTQDGQYVYVLDPNMEEVVFFEGVKNSHRQMTYATKQLVAREIELERMRRTESPRIEVEEKPKDTPTKPGPKGPADDKQLPNYMRQKLQPKAVVEEDKPVVDFFGRKMIKKTPEAGSKKEKKVPVGGEVYFKFKEGYTNAVRKVIKIKDLLS